MEGVVLKMGTRGRLVIPKKVRDALNIQENVKLTFDEKNRKIIITPQNTRQLKLSEL